MNSKQRIIIVLLVFALYFLMLACRLGQFVEPTLTPTSNIPITSTFTSIPPTPSLDKGIQDVESGHWYLVLPSMGWDQASQHCSSFGGHLVIIDSASEDNFVYNYVYLSHHGASLGATDKDDEGNWVWVTGEKMSYANWANGQPDNCGDRDQNGNCAPENYLSYYDDDPGKWNDISGEIESYICEFEN